MPHDAAWHAEYLRLENAMNAAREVYCAADRLASRKRPPAGAADKRAAALAAYLAAANAQFGYFGSRISSRSATAGSS